MVAVQMGHHHHIYLVGADAVGLEVVHQLAPRSLGGVGGTGAHAGVHQNGAALGADEIGGQVEADLVPVNEVLTIALPLVVGLVVGEKVAQVKFKNTVGQGSNFHIPHSNPIAGHITPPAKVD